MILITGYAINVPAKDDSVELTGIKVDNLDGQTIININTSEPVKFLYYKLDDPPRLLIDFVGTNILSREPEKIIFKDGYIKEIQSVFYEGTGVNNRQKLDLLVLKFTPNVMVKIEGKKEGISLRVKEAVVISKVKDSPLKYFRAKRLADKIARVKNDEKEVITLAAASQENINEEIITENEKPQTAPTSYILGLYEKSLGKGLNKLTIVKLNNKENDKVPLVSGYSVNKDPGEVAEIKMTLVGAGIYKPNWLALTIFSAVFALGLFVVLESLKLKKYLKDFNLKNGELAELREFIKGQFVWEPERKEELFNQEDIINNLDKCCEKREFTRFDLPEASHLSIRLEIETEASDTISLSASNLSLGGLGIELNKEVKIPKILQLGLKLPDSGEVVQVLAKVVWTKENDPGGRQYGLSFEMLTDDEEEKIKKFISDNF